MFGKSISDKTIRYILNSFLEADTLEKYYYSIRCIELLKEDPRTYRKEVELRFEISTKQLEDINLELFKDTDV